MSISTLSLTRFPGSISGLLQVASLLSLLLLLFKAAQFLLRRQWLLKALQQFPSPPSHWFFGHKDQELQYILKWVNEFPSAFPHWLWGSKVRVLIYDPEYMKAILGRSGYGLLLLNGETWFQHRRMLTPAFHYDILKPYVGITADSVRVMLDKWEQLIGQDSLEIFQHVSLMTLDTIMKCAFSYQGIIQLERNSKSYIQAIGDLNYLFFSRARNVFHQNDTIYRLTSDGRLFQHACQLAHEHTDQVIGQRKAQLQNEGELEKIRQKRHLDFLDILLCAKVSMWWVEKPETLPRRGRNKPCSLIHGLPRWRMGAACLMRTCVPRWTPSCLRAMTPQPVLSPGSSMLWPHTRSISRSAGRRSSSSHLSPNCPPGFMVTLSIYGLHHNPKVWPNPEVGDHFLCPCLVQELHWETICHE
uniref:Uncharacterized protein n=1 Tax=Spermophilus dauricus TaxID=99837 RepID=A0A8C9PUC1_SPEDA